MHGSKICSFSGKNHLLAAPQAYQSIPQVKSMMLDFEGKKQWGTIFPNIFLLASGCARLQSRRIIGYVDVLSSCLNRKRKAAESVSGFRSVETDGNPFASEKTKVAMIRPESADARNEVLGSQNSNLGSKGSVVVSTVLIKYWFYILLYSTEELLLVSLYFPLIIS